MRRHYIHPPRATSTWNGQRGGWDRPMMGRGYGPPRPRGAWREPNFWNRPGPGGYGRPELVKRCLNCDYFSSNHLQCTKCGEQLRPDAKLFRNPYKVHEMLKELIDIVGRNDVGPDFQPLMPATTEVQTSILSAANFMERESGRKSMGYNHSNQRAFNPNQPILDGITKTSSQSPADRSRPSHPSSTSLAFALPPDNQISIGCTFKPSAQSHSVQADRASDKSPLPLVHQQFSDTAGVGVPELENVASPPRTRLKAKRSLERTRKQNSPNPVNIEVIQIPSDDDDVEEYTPEVVISEPPWPSCEADIAEDTTAPTNESTIADDETTGTEVSNTVQSSPNDVDRTNPVQDSEPDDSTNASTEKETLTESKKEVKFCHCCDLYSFNLKNCSSCSKRFKKRNVMLNPIVEFSQLSESQLKCVHNLTEDISEPSSPETENQTELNQNEDDESLQEGTDLEDSTLKSKSSNVLPQDSPEPSQEPQGPDIEIPLLTDLGSSHDPLCFVRQCPKCFSYRQESYKCGLCKRRFSKRLKMVLFSSLTNEEKEISKSKLQQFLADQYRNDQDRIQQQLKKFEAKLRQQLNEKYGLDAEAVEQNQQNIVPNSSHNATNETPANSTRKRKHANATSSTSEESNPGQENDDVSPSKRTHLHHREK